MRATHRHPLATPQVLNLKPSLQSAAVARQGSRADRVALTSLTAMLLPVLLFTGCSGEKPGIAEAPPPKVTVATVRQQNVPIYFEAVGQTEATDNVEIRARVQGFLIEAPYKQGSPVKADDVLFRVDARPFQAALDQANAELTKTLASLEKAQADVSRLKPLVDEDAVPRQDFENAEASLKIAEGNVASMRAAVANAELNLSFTTMRAPFDGMIGGRNADVGSLVGTPDKSLLATISKVDPMRVGYTVSEADYLTFLHAQGRADAEHKLRGENLEFELTLGDGSAYPAKGRFDFVERALDPRTGTIKLRVLFSNPAGLLRPGQFVRLRTQTAELPDALLIPQRAVTELQSLKSVLVVGEGNVVQQRGIEVGDQSGNDVVVTHGLKAGERVIVDGLQKARAGAKVTPVESDAGR